MARTDVEVQTWQPTGKRVLWLAIATVMVVLPHVTRVPVWLTVGFVVLAIWAVGASYGRWPRAGKVTQFLVSLSAPLGVLVSFGTLLGRVGILAKLITYSGDIDHLEAGERWWFSFSTLSDQVGSSPPCVES